MKNDVHEAWTILTKEQVQESQQFKDWTKGQRIVKIHNVYHDQPETYAAWIVIGSDELGKFYITRFFLMAEKIQVSQDYKAISATEVFDVLLTEYSRGLK